jgi:hypothetical protein
MILIHIRQKGSLSSSLSERYGYLSFHEPYLDFEVSLNFSGNKEHQLNYRSNIYNSRSGSNNYNNINSKSI